MVSVSVFFLYSIREVEKQDFSWNSFIPLSMRLGRRRPDFAVSIETRECFSNAAAFGDALRTWHGYANEYVCPTMVKFSSISPCIERYEEQWLVQHARRQLSHAKRRSLLVEGSIWQDRSVRQCIDRRFFCYNTACQVETSIIMVHVIFYSSICCCSCRL